MTPEILQGLAEVAGTVVAVIGSLVLPMIALKVREYTGIKIDEKHMRALHEAARSWAQTAIVEDPRTANRAAGEALESYLRDSVPDAYRALAPTANVVRTLAGRYLSEKVSKALQ